MESQSILNYNYKYGNRSSCENQKGIKLASIASKLLKGINLQRFPSNHKRCTGESHSGYRPSRGCIDHFHFATDLRTEARSVEPRFLSFLTLKRRSTQLIVHSCGAGTSWRVCRRNSFHLSDHWVQTAEKEIVLMTIFTRILQEKWSLLGIILSSFLFNCHWDDWRGSYPHARTVTLIC